MVESRSKTPVRSEQAEAIVRDAFGDGVRLVARTELTDGYFNAVHRLDLDDGRSVVLKVAPPPDVEVLWYEHDLLHAEIETLRLLRSRTSAPVPEVVWVDEATRLPSPSFLMTVVPGVSLHTELASVPSARLAALDRTIGGHLAEVHAITNPTFGVLAPTRPAHESWPAAFGELYEQLLLDGERRNVELPVGYDELRAAFDSCADDLAVVTVPRLVVWDLWDGNVMVDPRTHELGGYLDVERALWGDPLLEFQFGPHGRTDAVIEGYGSDPIVTGRAQRRRALYTLYHHLVMGIEGAYREYPEDPLGDWARSMLQADLTALAAAGRQSR